MIIAGIILLSFSLFILLSAISAGGFLGSSFRGFLLILGLGIALLISGITKKKNDGSQTNAVKSNTFIDSSIEEHMVKMNHIMSSNDEAYFSVSEIARGIVNLVDAKEKLNPIEYYWINNIFNKLTQNNTLIPLDKANYLITCMNLISNFDLIAPYHKYCEKLSMDDKLSALLEEDKVPYRRTALLLCSINKLFSPEWETLRKDFYEKFHKPLV